MAHICDDHLLRKILLSLEVWVELLILFAKPPKFARAFMALKPW